MQGRKSAVAGCLVMLAAIFDAALLDSRWPASDWTTGCDRTPIRLSSEAPWLRGSVVSIRGACPGQGLRCPVEILPYRPSAGAPPDSVMTPPGTRPFVARFR